ncbi:ABC transporter permease [Chryseolinea sp. T2]|uniref:ABC transporter permease n=1 Tax=Chryseolinea sp. T2 TaxID=3129255 RepID=UPI00307819B1
MTRISDFADHENGGECVKKRGGNKIPDSHPGFLPVHYIITTGRYNRFDRRWPFSDISISANPNVMIRNYISVALRNILRRKLFSFINAFGLSVGIAFCALIYLYIEDERSFDQFHVNKDRIFRMEVKSFNTWDRNPDKPFDRHAWMQMGLQPALKEDFPEVEFAARFNPDGEYIFRFGDKAFTEKIAFTDGDFFKMFSFSMLSGNAGTIFNTPLEVVLTPAIASKYFGNEDPIGKTVVIDIMGEKSYIVTGLIDAPPANSSIDFSILVPTQNRWGYDRRLTEWNNYNNPTFVQLVPNADMSTFNRNLDKLVDKHLGNQIKKWRKESSVHVPDDVKLLEFVYTALPDIHLKTEIGWTKVSDPQYSIILGGLAALILFIACINYVSLALTTSVSRRTEVGVRKVVGAQKSQLVYQFGLESIVLAMISMVVAFGLVFLFLPTFNEFTGKGISITFGRAFSLLSVSIGLTLIVGLLAGSYPALFLSAFRPAAVLKGRFTSKLQTGFTRPLVVLQFAMSAFLIISTVVMYRQMNYVTTKELGFDQEQIIAVRTQTGWNKEADRTVERFRTRLQHESSVGSVAGTTSSFNRGYSRYGYKIDGEQHSTFVYGVDSYYVPTLNLELVLGRNFSSNIPSDTNAVLVNEALVREMKWSDPLNEHLNWKEDTVGLGSRVIGVLKDYHFQSLTEVIQPMLLSMDTRYAGHLETMLVKLEAGNLPDRVKSVQKAWNELSPGKPFDYTFIDEDVARQYERHTRWMKITSLAAAFAILISCLGLFGLAGINAVNRTKEIGIRKVLGAGISSIFFLLNRQYLWLSLIAFTLAAPASWYAMSQWLSGFKFSIELGWELFVICMLGGLLVALASVSYHTVRTASVNPAETLKHE